MGRRVVRDWAIDADSFAPLAPAHEAFSARWIDDRLIAFTDYSRYASDGVKEIIIWDFENESVARRIPVMSENYWSWLIDGDALIASSELASGIPSTYLDIETTNGDIVFSEHVGEYAWSADGYLAFCGIDEGFSRILSIWDGDGTQVVAEVSYRPVRWLNGGPVFSCNNG